MILDLLLLGLIVIVIGASMIHYEELVEKMRNIQDEIMNVLDSIPSVFSLTILLMSAILIMSVLIAMIPKT